MIGVTGATGTIGGELIRLLSSHGERARASRLFLLTGKAEDHADSLRG